MYDSKIEMPYKDLSPNFVCRNSVYIMDEITNVNCSRLIADIREAIEMAQMTTKQIEFIINSPGGDAYMCKSILAMMKLANKNNIATTSYVIGLAGSSASIIAIAANTRYISKDAEFYIHYGTIGNESFHPTENERNYRHTKQFHEWIKQQYLQYTKIPETRLNEILEHESGYITAKEALKYKFVDSIF